MQALTLAKPKEELLQKAKGVKGDIYVAVVRPSEAGVLITLGRFKRGKLVVVETAVDATLQQLAARVKPLVQKAKATKQDATLHGGAHAPRRSQSWAPAA